MNFSSILWSCVCCFLLSSVDCSATTYLVNSQSSFDNAHDNANANDSIVWESGTFSDIYMLVDKDNLYIGAEVSGGAIFNGESRARINGDNITFEGFQYIGGDISEEMVIDVYGSHITLTQLNIDEYICFKYLRVREQCQYVDISWCNFENRLNLIDQNILSILVDENQPGYNKVRHCSFKNFDGTGDDQGIEPVRIGVSTQAEFISRSTVEYCFFTQCNGDGELISSKAAQNVYRYNTFDDNPLAELVLRHGDENIVYGNFFLNGKGGVRVREGQDHYIYNNYFYNINDRAIFIQNEPEDPLDNINIAFNVLVDCDEIILGGTGDDEPTNITFANNIFTNPNNEIVDDPTGNETWIGNIGFGDLGMSYPSGITDTDPQLDVNSEGFYGLSASSPAIDAAQSGYAALPQFAGMDPIDSNIDLDMMQQSRPLSISQKDIGPNEYPHNTTIKPIADATNTGPWYLTGYIPPDPPADTLVNLNANGSSDTYALITSILAPGANPIETPDCSHSAFGDHIDQEFDADLNDFCFRFHIHVTPDVDRCINFDRQRNELKTYAQSPDNLKGEIGESVVYKWKFKLDAGFQSSSRFTHLHQLKSVGGSLSDKPMYTLSARKGTPDQLELLHAKTNSAVTLTQTDLAPFIDTWLEVTETITYGNSGFYEIRIQRVSDEETLFYYVDAGLTNWRIGAEFVRPKWGIYRSLEFPGDLRDEIVRFADFSIEELTTDPSVEVDLTPCD